MMLLVYVGMAPFLVGAAALLAERALRATGRPGRVPWLVAPLLSVALAGLALSGRAVIPVPVAPGAAGSAGQGPAPAMLFTWATLSGLLLAAVLLQWLRLRARARRWLPARVGGVAVRLSAATGPVTLGVLRPVIVLPRWVLGLAPRERRLVLLHELEHARARDVAAQAWALLFLVLVPWHPALWWHATRLHRAVEMDCDGRVVRRTGNVARYARLLLAAGERTLLPPLPAAALGMGRPLLERRLRALLVPPSHRGALLAGCASAALIAVACAAPLPGEPEPGAVGVYRLVEDGAPAGGVIRPVPGGPVGVARFGPGTPPRALREQTPSGAPVGVMRRRPPS